MDEEEAAVIFEAQEREESAHICVVKNEHQALTDVKPTHLELEEAHTTVILGETTDTEKVNSAENCTSTEEVEASVLLDEDAIVIATRVSLASGYAENVVVRPEVNLDDSNAS